jgi:hypothetical protein
MHVAVFVVAVLLLISKRRVESRDVAQIARCPLGGG